MTFVSVNSLPLIIISLELLFNTRKISINNLLGLITEAKEIPDVFNHLTILKEELDEIKSFKEENF